MNDAKSKISPPLLGIAITTMNRAPHLERLLSAIKEFTNSEHFVVVCDDGSTDATRDVAFRSEATYICGDRRGVAWNKNRGIYSILNNSCASHIILMDDDILPAIYGWDQEWIKAIDRFGHINYAHAGHSDYLVGPRVLSATCPGVSKMLSGVCLGFSRRVLSEIGYMDNRFGRYGYEHADLTERALRTGYGGFYADQSFFFVIRGGIDTLTLPSSASSQDLELSTKHFSDPERSSAYMLPWHNPQQREVFLSEIDDMHLPHIRFKEADIAGYVSRNPDVDQRLLGGVEHWLQYGQHEGRKWGL